MSAAADRSNKDKVLRHVGRLLAASGFRRTKPTFFTRCRVLLVEFVHLHKYTFAPEFRVHLGLRVTNDVFEAPALNGPDSEPYVCKGSPAGRRFNFTFGETPGTIERCAAEIADYVRDVAEPWFLRWHDGDRLLDDPSSPLSDEAKECLRTARRSGPLAERVELTRRLLGTA